jgi:hypothetical protein
MNIITRGEWGARPARSSTPCTWGSRCVVHHTAGEYIRPAGKRPGPRWWLAKYRANRRVQQAISAYRRADSRVEALEKQSMRQTQAFHMDGHGWSDIGYHYVIFPSGRVYEGRAARTVGAHALNGNMMPGVSFAGNYERDQPTEAAVAAYHELLDHLGVREAVGHYRVPGNQTACPGRHLKTRLGV